MQRSARVVLSALACPRHLSVVLALLCETVIEGALAAHQLWLFVAMSLFFTVAIAGLLLELLCAAGAGWRGARIHRPAHRWDGIPPRRAPRPGGGGLHDGGQVSLLYARSPGMGARV